MPSILSLDSFEDERYAANLQYSNNSNSKDVDEMKRLLSKAMYVNLTNRQRECITMHYLQNMRLIDIAHELNLDKSTVSRHISNGIKKLKKLNALI